MFQAIALETKGSRTSESSISTSTLVYIDELWFNWHKRFFRIWNFYYHRYMRTTSEILLNKV